VELDAEQSQQDVASRRSSERRVWRRAFLLSLGLHVLVFLLGPLGTIPISPFGAAGPDQGDDLAAEGFLEVVALQSAPPDAALPIPLPTLDLELPEPETVIPDATPEIALDLPEVPEPGTGTSQGTDPDDVSDVGVVGVAGLGDAGVAEEGRSRLIPPSPRGMIMPPTNRNLRGSQIEVWVFVNEAGRVEADSTQLRPPTSDRGFNEQLAREAAQWVFEPARQDGEPVAAWFPYLISMD
jgi:hypothetical protein